MIEVPVLTIDGPGGSGKGTVSLKVAESLGWHYLDSGALYRVVGFLAGRRGVALDDEDAVAGIARHLEIEFVGGDVVLDGKSLDQEIRTEQAGNSASRVAGLPAVRQGLLEWQRQCAKAPGLVADGRDMGTVVFPGAKCKIYLTASPRARAERRFNQLRLKGFDVTIRRLFEEITERDERDANRTVSPLKPATDAIVLDSTDMTIDQVVAEVLSQLGEACAHHGELPSGG